MTTTIIYITIKKRQKKTKKERGRDFFYKNKCLSPRKFENLYKDKPVYK